jgi:hypothetical protein
VPPSLKWGEIDTLSLQQLPKLAPILWTPPQLPQTCRHSSHPHPIPTNLALPCGQRPALEHRWRLGPSSRVTHRGGARGRHLGAELRAGSTWGRSSGLATLGAKLESGARGRSSEVACSRVEFRATRYGGLRSESCWKQHSHRVPKAVSRRPSLHIGKKRNVEGGTHLYRGLKNRGSLAVSPFLAQKNLVLVLLTHCRHSALYPSILCSPPRTHKISMARSALEHPSYYYAAARSGSSSSAMDSYIVAVLFLLLTAGGSVAVLFLLYSPRALAIAVTIMQLPAFTVTFPS